MPKNNKFQKKSFAGRVPNPEHLLRLAANQPSALDLELCNGDYKPCRNNKDLA